MNNSTLFLVHLVKITKNVEMGSFFPSYDSYLLVAQMLSTRFNRGGAWGDAWGRSKQVSTGQESSREGTVEFEAVGSKGEWETQRELLILGVIK